MGYFKIRRALAVSGGSVVIGADTNLYRSSANVLKTDDALTVASTLTAQGAFTQSGGAISLGGTITSALNVSGSANFSGTPFKIPYQAASPTLGANGDIRIYHKSDVAYLAFQSNGTPYAIALPATTHGTITVTANSLP